MELKFSFLEDYWRFFLEGTEITIILSIFAVTVGTVLGILIVLIRRCRIKPLKWIGTAYVEFIRGTPLLAQIYLVYIGVPTLLPGFDFPDLVVGIIALSMNAGAYISETIRSGIEAVNIGQTEAARSLGMSSKMTMKDIILPQAFKNILPALGNQFIGSIKDSSIISTIGVADLMYKTQIVRGNTALGLEPIIVCSFIYLIMTFVLSRVLGVVERRLKTGDRKQ